MQTIVLKNEDLDLTVMREILEFRSQIFEEAYQLRSEKPDEFSTKTPDKYDERSIHFVIREGDVILAYARMILAPITELPIFNYCPTLPNSQEIAVEISRFCVSTFDRGNFSGLAPIYHLFIEMAKFSLSIGINSWYCGFNPIFYRAAKRLFNAWLQPLGPERRFSKAYYTQPALFDVIKTVAQNQHRIYTQYMVSKLENPSEFERRRLQVFGRLMAAKVMA